MMTKTGATLPQIKYLRKLGYAGDASSLTAKEASEAIAVLTDVADLKDRVDLIDFAERYIELQRATKHEKHGPCPWCGGNDRFIVKATGFWCRVCDEKGDALDLAQKLAGVDFAGALSILRGHAQALPVAKLTPDAKPAASTWDGAAYLPKLKESHTALMAGKAPTACQAYLEGRDLDPATWAAFGVGFNAVGLPSTWDKEKGEYIHPKQWAIALPWYDRSGGLVAVKYRFLAKHTYTDIEGNERTESKTSRGSSSGVVFGWQALQGPQSRPALIITEGEINALSLWQAGGGVVDVLSAGSESTTKRLPSEVIELAKQYRHVIVWADKGSIAERAAIEIGCASMQSPNGLDANDLLQRGFLPALVRRMLEKQGFVTPDRDMSLGGVFDYVGHTLRPTELEKLRQRAASIGFEVGAVEDGAGFRVVRIHTPGMDCTRPSQRMVAEFWPKTAA